MVRVRLTEGNVPLHVVYFSVPVGYNLPAAFRSAAEWLEANPGTEVTMLWTELSPEDNAELLCLLYDG